MKAIMVGAGGATRDLLRRLGAMWDVTVVDTDRERLELAESVREISSILGDGSSRVVLTRAGIEDADALVAATSDDAVNLEVCRIARQAGLLRVVAVAAAPERVAEYRQIQVPAFAPDSLAARQVELSLEPRRVSSTAFAHGRAEAIEFEIAPDSPVRGVPLMDLNSESWLVAAILRDDRLIVPHGNSVLETGDLVTVVGAASDFSFIVRTFTSGEARFPLDFGKRAAVALDSAADLDGPVAEAIDLTRSSRATSVLIVHRRLESVREEAQQAEIASLLERVEESATGVELKLRPVDGSPRRALASVVAGESVGVVVLPGPRRGFLGLLRATRALRDAAKLDRPVLFSRGSHPYHDVVSPARNTPSGVAAARAAIDLAGYGKMQLSGVAVISPRFLTGVDGRGAALRAFTRLREEAAVQGVTVRRRLRQGNPIRVLADASKGAGLLVLGGPERTPILLRPTIVGHLLARVDASILVVPVRG